MCGLLFICLLTLFMSNEQYKYKRRWSLKEKKEKKRAKNTYTSDRNANQMDT